MENKNFNSNQEVQTLPQPLHTSQQGLQTLPQTFHMSQSQQILPQNCIFSAGVSLQQAQFLNCTYLANWLALVKRHWEKEQDYQYELAIQKLKQGQVNFSNEIICENVSQGHFDLKELIADFVKVSLLVKRRARLPQRGHEFLIRDEELMRHVIIDEKTLKYFFEEFLSEQFPIETDIPQKYYERAWRILLNSIPCLEKSSYQVIAPYQIVFLNGIFDFKTMTFNVFDNKQFFNEFSIPIQWNYAINQPSVFGKVLSDMFQNDDLKIILAYQFIGAMLSSIPTLKKIFVLQGVSNGGKSRLAQIILKLFDESDVIFLDTLSDITQDYVERNLRSCLLIYIDEASDKKILPRQASALKTIANGCGNAKILIGTNHSLYTGENGFVEPALLNRFAVLPFEAPMQNIDPEVSAFEDLYFEQEKFSIIQQSLYWFQQVIVNKMNFYCEFTLNAVVSIPEKPSDKNSILENFLLGNYVLADEMIKETTTNLLLKNLIPFIDRKNSAMLRLNC